MNVYIYRAALYCEDCGNVIKESLGYVCEGMSEYSYDSDDYPKGPYSEGSGESDTPQHCDNCGLFLENPLTEDGYTYVWNSIANYVTSQSGDFHTLLEWSEFYNLEGRM